jgi:hypothetical protein
MWPFELAFATSRSCRLKFKLFIQELCFLRLGPNQSASFKFGVSQAEGEGARAPGPTGPVHFLRHLQWAVAALDGSEDSVPSSRNLRW